MEKTLIKDNMDRFKSLVKQNCNREGIDDLLQWLEQETDFFIAPASARYHGSYEGGLLQHSLNVYDCLMSEAKQTFGEDFANYISIESITIVSLFHDLCKIDTYVKDFRNIKDSNTGMWETVECYLYNDNCLSLGHASKSIYYIQNYIKLFQHEAQAIYWHMGAFDLSQYSTTKGLGSAYTNNILAFLLHIADEKATYIEENDVFLSKYYI